MTGMQSGSTLRVLRPESEGWDEARSAWNLAVDQRPEAIVVAESAQELASAVALARAEGLRVAAQGTGHGAGALGPLEGTLLLRTDRLRGVRVDPESRIARIEAGTLALELVEAAAEHGLAPLAGSSPDVGVVGYLLGGGLSWLGRKHGLAAHGIVAADVVTADGRLVRADDNENTELLWALRGGGGNFGVVSALEVGLRPLAEVYAGILWYPFERASEILQAWGELARGGLPDELTTVGRLLQLPPLPEIPEPVRGKSFVVVEVIHCGDPEVANGLLAPLRALGPVDDTLATMSLPQLSHLHMDPEHPVPGVGDGLMLDALPPEAIERLVTAAGPGSGSPLLSVEVRQLGGALAVPRPEHAALASAEAEYALWGVGIAATPELARASEAQLAVLKTAVSPWTAKRMVPNFADTRRDPSALWGDACERLRGLKETIDPDDVFRANHPLLSS
jgi:hypothetical protein